MYLPGRGYAARQAKEGGFNRDEIQRLRKPGEKAMPFWRWLQLAVSSDLCCLGLSGGVSPAWQNAFTRLPRGFAENIFQMRRYML